MKQYISHRYLSETQHAAFQCSGHAEMNEFKKWFRSHRLFPCTGWYIFVACNFLDSPLLWQPTSSHKSFFFGGGGSHSLGNQILWDISGCNKRGEMRKLHSWMHIPLPMQSFQEPMIIPLSFNLSSYQNHNIQKTIYQDNLFWAGKSQLSSKRTSEGNHSMKLRFIKKIHTTYILQYKWWLWSFYLLQVLSTLAEIGPHLLLDVLISIAYLMIVLFVLLG